MIEALTPQLEAASAAIDAAHEAATAANARHWQARAALLETRVWIEAAPLLADLLEARTIAFRSPTLPDSAMLARRASTALREASEASEASEAAAVIVTERCQLSGADGHPRQRLAGRGLRPAPLHLHP